MFPSTYHIKEVMKMIENFNKSTESVERFVINLYKKNPTNKNYFYIEMIALQNILRKKIAKNKELDIPDFAIQNEAKKILQKYQIRIHCEDPNKMNNVNRVPDEELLSTPIDTLEWTSRSLNCLKDEGVTTLKDLVLLTEAELLRTPNFGRKSLNEVIDKLDKLGLRLNMDLDVDI